MTFVATPEQQAVIDAPLTSLCVAACAGSGKTATAVRRLAEVRKRLENDSAYVVLLSHSNVAVETFRREFRQLVAGNPLYTRRVAIETVDSFFLTRIVRPHASPVMRTTKSPFLVTGSEPFLSTFAVWHEKRPYPISDLSVEIEDDELAYYLRVKNGRMPIDTGIAEGAIQKLGKHGAYTHETGRYWALMTLAENEELLAILSRRYPQILVDECQDIGSVQRSLLELLHEKGSVLTLIGDPHQSIYEFSGADGKFLTEFAGYEGVTSMTLSQNRRSLPPIIEIANSISGSKSTAFRERSARKHGGFYISYDEKKLDQLMSSFASVLQSSGYEKSKAAVICRSNSSVGTLKAGGDELGTGATLQFALAAIERDRNGDIAKAFEHTANGMLKLLKSPSATLRRDLLGASCEGDIKRLKHHIWKFLRSDSFGLPNSVLSGKDEWQPNLKLRLKAFLDEVKATTNFEISPKWAYNVTNKGLTSSPLWKDDFAGKNWTGIRVGTVHSVKGESIPAVLYVGRTADISAMAKGTFTEAGRIGYVAVTRAKDLLLVAVPDTAKPNFLETLKKIGFQDLSAPERMAKAVV